MASNIYRTCRSKKGGDRLLGVFMDNAKVASMERLSPTAYFKQMAFSTRAVVLEINTPAARKWVLWVSLGPWYIPGIYYIYILRACVILYCCVQCAARACVPCVTRGGVFSDLFCCRQFFAVGVATKEACTNAMTNMIPGTIFGGKYIKKNSMKTIASSTLFPCDMFCPPPKKKAGAVM